MFSYGFGLVVRQKLPVSDQLVYRRSVAAPESWVGHFTGAGGSRFLDRYQHALTWPQVKVLNAIVR
jgi:hypothetical protein